MKKLFIAIFFILLLSGCTAISADKELVEDSAVAEDVWSEDANEILLELPAGTELISETKTWALYTLNDGEFEIVTARFLCSDGASAVRLLTGYNSQNLNTIKKSSEFGEERYVTWCAMGEGGKRVYCADILSDGIHTYCVICSFSEDAQRRYDEEILRVFTGFGLSGKNIV